MSKNSKLVAALCGSVSTLSLFATVGYAQTPCPATLPVTLTPPPDVTCFAIIQVPGNKLNSFDISWADSFRAGAVGGGRYFLADRSNAGIDIINSQAASFLRRLTGFAGIVLTNPTTINNNKSGPNGVVSHNAWLYAGDGNSTLKVFNLDAGTATPNFTVSTVAPSVTSLTRLDEMDITPDGLTLLAANNAEDPPFATQFLAEGDATLAAAVAPVPKIQWSVDATIMPPGFGLSLEQPRWVPAIQRFVVGIPIINSNSATLGPGQSPVPCNYNQNPALYPCDGAVVVIDPTNTASVALPPGLDAPPPGTLQVALTVYNPATKTGVIPLSGGNLVTPAGTYSIGCGPNGVALNPNNGILGLACTPGNDPNDVITGAILSGSLSNPLLLNNNTFPSPQVTGGDELWFNFTSCTYPMIVVPFPGQAACGSVYGDQRFYIGASKNNTYSYNLNGFPKGTQTGAPTSGPVLGIMGGAPVFQAALGYNALPLIGTIPVSSGSHSVATDAVRNNIFVPFVAPACKAAGCNTSLASDLNVIGGDTTGNRQNTSNSFLTCGTNNGCIAIFRQGGTQN
jgi:hypothetical protein